MSSSFKILNNSSVAANVISGSVDILSFSGFSVHCIIAGSSPNGTLKVQSSNDGSNWEDVPDATYSVTTDVSVLFNCVEQEYHYFRVSYTFTSGSGTINAYVTLKE